MTLGAYSRDLDKLPYSKLSNKELVSLRAKYLGGADKEAWHRMWLHGVRLVLKIVNHMDERGILRSLDKDEAIAEGNLAIGPALLSWQPKKGPYSTWVWIKIRGAILDAVVQDRVCGLIGGPTDDVQVVANTHDAGHGEFLLSDLYDSGQVDDRGYQEVLMDDLHKHLDKLSKRERTYLYQIDFLGIPASDVARADGVSRQRVDQVLSLARNRLSRSLDD